MDKGGKPENGDTQSWGDMEVQNGHPAQHPDSANQPIVEKKDLSRTMATTFDPAAVESGWYDWWDSQGFFAPQLDADGKPNPEGVFVVPLPPPTVNGSLHIGHAMTIAIEDTLSRWNRMLGKTTLFLPGFDHGGISTEYVVEKRLHKHTGLDRYDIGREKLLHTIQAWNTDQQATITEQLRRLGGSYDWSRTAFTMDEKLSKAVIETFCRLHDEGIIYRAHRFVNWCVKLNTSLSSLEVEQKRLDGRVLLHVPGYPLTDKFEFGVLTKFAYPIEDSDEQIMVSTTRPETMLGDTALAVHPHDQRYKHLHGKFAIHPFVQRRIPIIADASIFDIDAGTGVVKIAPAHDPTEYEICVRHKLDIVHILNDDGTLNANAGEKFTGMKRYHARVAVVQALKDAGLHAGDEDHPMVIVRCQKSGDIVEPMLKRQWWVRCKPLADAVIKHTRAGELLINPHQAEDEWYQWLENIQDWCISRQLCWGHQCPAYFVRIQGRVQDPNDPKSWIVGRTLEEATVRAKVLAGDAPFTLERDEDVLDTWFSSALWPFAIMGWPDHTADLKYFYPCSILETGVDTFFSWVARMALLGIFLTGVMPFKEVFCHGMVRDAYGQKMGKSLGNGVDPIDIIQGLPLNALHEKLFDGNLDGTQIAKAKAGQKKNFPNGIPQCGTDALRLALCSHCRGGLDINLEIRLVEGYRKFCNRIFNAVRLSLLKFDGNFIPAPAPEPRGEESLVELWILHKLNITAGEMNKQFAARDFKAATAAVYNFWSHDLLDVYLKAFLSMMDMTTSAAVRNTAQQTLYTCLDHGLRLLHPFMPFVTEELWQRLPRRLNDLTPSIMISRYPVFAAAFVFEEAHRDFELVLSAINHGRALAASYPLQPDIQLYLHARTHREAALLEAQLLIISSLVNGCKSTKVARDENKIPPGSRSAVVTRTVAVYTVVQGVVELNGEIAKHTKMLDLSRLPLEPINGVEV